jgi:hypothetical protein
MSELFALFGGGASGDDAVATGGEVATQLRSADRRARMAAYAYLYANPDPIRIGELIDAVTTEGTPFGQYWGVRALRRSVQAVSTPIGVPIRRRLEQLATALDPDTDGAGELRDLLREATG